MSTDELRTFLASSDVLTLREAHGKKPTLGSSVCYVLSATFRDLN